MAWFFIFFLKVILNVILTQLIDGIVCQVLEQVGDIAIFGAHVRVGGKTGQTVVEKVDAKRVNTENENIHSKIEL